MDYDDATGVFRIVLALKEALINAIDHGNLELDSKLREHKDNRYSEMGKARCQQSPYSERRVRLISRISPHEVIYSIRDQGPGFDPSHLPDPRNPENLLKPHGRGMMLIQTFMDEVSHNETGNEITMIKRRVRHKKHPETHPSRQLVVGGGKVVGKTPSVAFRRTGTGGTPRRALHYKNHPVNQSPDDKRVLTGLCCGEDRSGAIFCFGVV